MQIDPATAMVLVTAELSAHWPSVASSYWNCSTVMLLETLKHYEARQAMPLDYQPRPLLPLLTWLLVLPYAPPLFQ